MPNGGLQVYGSGIRLQATTPGVTDIGNENISGVVAGGRVTTNPGNAANRGEVHGAGIVWTTTPPGKQTVILGNTVNLGTGNQTSGAFFGFGVSGFTQNTVAMGIQCQAGLEADGGANRTAIGQNVTVQTNAPVGSQGPDGVGLGTRINVQGARSVAVGRDISVQHTFSPDGVSVVMGTDHALGAVTTNLRMVVYGKGMTFDGRQNILAVGWWNSSDIPWPPLPLQDNMAIFGNQNQTPIICGLPMLPGQIGITRQINDADYVATLQDGTIQYVNITAPRQVTLQASGGNAVGSRILVADASGLATAVNKITIIVNAGGLIYSQANPAGVLSVVIDAPYKGYEFMMAQSPTPRLVLIRTF